MAIRTCMFQKADCFRKISTKLVVLLCKCVYLCLYILSKCVYLYLYILCKCVYLCLYILGKFRDVRTTSGLEYKLFILFLFLCVCTPVSPSVPEMAYMPLECILYNEDVWRFCNLYLPARQVRFTVGDYGVCVSLSGDILLFVDSVINHIRLPCQTGIIMLL